jgi:hypothetical protein
MRSFIPKLWTITALALGALVLVMLLAASPPPTHGADAAITGIPSDPAGSQPEQLGGPPPQLMGDVDCSGTVNSVDALKVLRFTVDLSVSQSEPCPDIGNTSGSGFDNGDVDCDNDVDPVDALRILRYNAALSVIQNEPCPDIGT